MATPKTTPRPSLKSSVLWLTSLKLVSQAIMWCLTFVTIRILLPEDYGLNALREVATSFVMVFVTSSIAASVIQRDSTSDREKEYLNGFIISLSIALFAFQWIFSAIYADWYSEPELISLVRVSSICLLLSAAYAIPQAELGKDMEFKFLGLVDLATSVTAGIVTLVFAYQGYGVWSFVYGILCRVGLRTVLLIAKVDRYPYPKFGEFRLIAPQLRYNLLLVAAAFVYIIYEKIDVIVVSAFFDTPTIGIYSVSMQIALLVLSKSLPSFKAVAFPVYSNSKNNEKEILYYFYKSLRMSTTILAPLLIGIGVSAQYWVPLVLGEKWSDTAPVILAICIALPFRIIIELVTPLLKAKGAAGTIIKKDLIAISIMATTLYAASSYGIVAIAYAWLFALPLVLAITISLTKRFVTISFLKILKTVMAPYICALLLILLGYGLQDFLSDFGNLSSLSILAIGGAALYFATMSLWSFSHLDEVIEFFGVKKLLLKRR